VHTDEPAGRGASSCEKTYAVLQIILVFLALKAFLHLLFHESIVEVVVGLLASHVYTFQSMTSTKIVKRIQVFITFQSCKVFFSQS
jgi:hypothetical protein